jgi:hypothetical protein
MTRGVSVMVGLALGFLYIRESFSPSDACPTDEVGQAPISERASLIERNSCLDY